MLDRFRCGYVAGDTGCCRDDGGMRVKALKIKGKRNLGTIEFRVSTSPWGSNDDLIKVFRLAVLKGFDVLVISNFEIAARIEETLSQREQFQAAVKQGRPDAAFTVFFDAEKVLNVASLAINMAASNLRSATHAG